MIFGRRRNKYQPLSINPSHGSPGSRRYQQRSQSWWARHRPILAALSTLLLIILIAGGGFYLSQRWLVVKHINVSTPVSNNQSAELESQLQAYLDQFKQGSLLWLNTETVQEQIGQKFPQIQHVHLTKDYPQSLQVSYTIRQEVAQIHSQGNYYLVDRSGVIFAQSESPHAPKIEADIPISINSQVSASSLTLSLHLVNSLRTQNLELQRIKLLDHYLEVDIKQSPQLLIGLDQSPSYLMPVIFDLMHRANQDKQAVKQIDLRFNRPVLRY